MQRKKNRASGERGEGKRKNLKQEELSERRGRCQSGKRNVVEHRKNKEGQHVPESNPTRKKENTVISCAREVPSIKRRATRGPPKTATGKKEKSLEAQRQKDKRSKNH